MKKHIMLVFLLVILAAAAAIATVALSAQNNDQAEWDQTPLSTETEIKIKQDYLDLFTKKIEPDAIIDDVMIAKYYGTNGNCFAVMMEDCYVGYLTVLGTEVVDGITIHYGSSNRMLIWEDGNFHPLKEAYDMGLLSKDNLMDISLIPFYYTDPE